MASIQRTFWLTIFTALVAISCGAAFVWRHLQLASDGVRLEPGDNALTAAGVLVTPLLAEPGGLQAGDLVVGFEGRSLNDWAENLFGRGTTPSFWSAGNTLHYRVIRAGEPIEVQVRLGGYPFWAVVRKNWGTIAFAVASLLVSSFVILRRPDHPAGRVLFLGAAFLTSSTAWSFGLQVSDFLDGIGFWLFKIATLLFYNLNWTATFHFALIFPQPLPVARQHRWLIPVSYLLPLGLLGIYLLAARSTASSLLDWFARWTVAEGAHAAVFLSLTLVSLVWQFRLNLSGITRRQIRWVMLAGLLTGGAGLMLYILPGALGWGAVGPNIAGLIVLPYPIAIGVAILRHNLFDIDTLLNRTLVYGTLTLGTIAIYVIFVGYLGNLFQATARTLIAFLATGLVAVIFQPLRAWLQLRVNRWMYGERDNPYVVLARLGKRLETTLEPEAIFPTIVETIAQALKLPYVAIALHEDEGDKIAASYGLPPAASRSRPETPVADGAALEEMPLTYQNQPAGRLILAPRAPDEPFTPAERDLIENLARQVEVAMHNIRLTADLRRSYQRLVTAREEERRRIRRDLHDGLGPQLAGLMLKTDAARNLLASDPGAAEKMLVEIKEHTQTAIADIRRLVYGLRPPALDELGLVKALQQQADATRSASSLEIKFQATEPLPALPAAVDAAIYHIAVEAMTNVIRHARASQCLIRLEVDREVRLEIRDDGAGLPAQVQAGVGLRSMRERAAELGGVCQVERGRPNGTRVRATIPLTN